MDGKRFGSGIIAGLLLGLFVISATSGFTFGLFGTFSASSYPNGGMVAQTTTATSTASQMVPSQQGNASNSTLNLATSVSATTSGSGSAPKSLAPATGVIFSSDLDSIAQQSPTANVFLLVPVLVAFLLGAAIYLISRRGKEGPEEPQVP